MVKAVECKAEQKTNIPGSRHSLDFASSKFSPCRLIGLVLGSYSVVVENLDERDAAVLITQSEFMRRYREMSALNGGMNFYGSLPESFTVTVNYSHPAIKKILNEKTEKLNPKVQEIETKLSAPQQALEQFLEKVKGKKEDEMDKSDRDEKERLESEVEKVKQERKELLAGFGKENELIRQVCDLALLSNGMLKGEELNKFVKRSLSLIS